MAQYVEGFVFPDPLARHDHPLRLGDELPGPQRLLESLGHLVVDREGGGQDS